MKDPVIQNSLAKIMVIGTAVAAALMLAGLCWYLISHPDLQSGDHVFRGEPKYFENPVSMIRRAMEEDEVGSRRSVVMIGVILLLINPVLRVGFAAVGYAIQRDRLYAAVSFFVLAVLLFSFFW